MALTTDVEARLCVAWKTTAPRSVVGRSHGFRFRGSEWRLQMSANGPPSNLYLVTLFKRDCKRPEPLGEPFRVTTFITEGEETGVVFLSAAARVRNTFEVVWTNSGDAIARCVPRFLEGAEFKVVCLFHGSPESAMQEDEVSTPDDVSSSDDVSRGLESLSSDLSKMLDDEESSDVKLICCDRTIFAHKIILAARSDVFAAMFRNKMVESETGAVNLSDLGDRVFDLFIKYIYSGKVLDLAEDSVSELYAAGDMYAVHELKDECYRWICRNLSKENCLDFLVLAEAHSDQAMKDAVAGYLLKNLDLLDDEAWNSLCEQHPKPTNYVYQKCFAAKYFKSGSQQNDSCRDRKD